MINEDLAHESDRWLRSIDLLAEDAADILEAGGWAASHPIDVVAALVRAGVSEAARMVPASRRVDGGERAAAIVEELSAALPIGEESSVLAAALCLTAIYVLMVAHTQLVESDQAVTERTSPAIRRQIAEILGGEA